MRGERRHAFARAIARTVRNPEAFGTIVGAVFAVPWMASGVGSLGHVWATWLTVVAIAISLTLVIASIHQASKGAHIEWETSSNEDFDGRAYGIAVAFMVVAIPVVAAVLRRGGLEMYTMPAVAFIVGVHFFGLVRAFGSRLFWWIGGAMCALAVVAVLILPPTFAWHDGNSLRQVNVWNLVVGVGCASIMWISGTYSLLSWRRARHRADAADRVVDAPSWRDERSSVRDIRRVRR
jgi:hypothetical protein